MVLVSVAAGNGSLISDLHHSVDLFLCEPLCSCKGRIENEEDFATKEARISERKYSWSFPDLQVALLSALATPVCVHRIRLRLNEV